MTSNTLHSADAHAIENVLAVEPELRQLKTTKEVAGLEKTSLLHAGPAFRKPADITKPILNSAVVASVYEGLAADFDEAETRIRAGEITLHPAQDFQVVTPLAAVVSASMAMQVVVDTKRPSRTAFSPINGGSSAAARLGLRSQAVLENLRWLNGPFADLLSRSLDTPVPLMPLARDGLGAGDDCHGRTPAASAAFAKLTSQKFGTGDAADRARRFLSGASFFFLNLWMAASKCMLSAAVGVSKSSLVTTATANGAETGIQLAGMPGRWFTTRADPPKGHLENDMPPERALGAIGDSAIVDALGLGAMVMAHAPEQQKNLLSFMPKNGLELPRRLLAAEHPGFRPLTVWVGTTARAVVACGDTPVVSLGILDVEGIVGRLGGGIYRPPLSLYETALATLECLPPPGRQASSRPLLKPLGPPSQWPG